MYKKRLAFFIGFSLIILAQASAKVEKIKIKKVYPWIESNFRLGTEKRNYFAKADCTTFAQIYYKRAKSLGWNVELAIGQVKNKYSGQKAWHAWCQVEKDGIWYDIEPQVGLPFGDSMVCWEKKYTLSENKAQFEIYKAYANIVKEEYLQCYDVDRFRFPTASVKWSKESSRRVFIDGTWQFISERSVAFYKDKELCSLEDVIEPEYLTQIKTAETFIVDEIEIKKIFDENHWNYEDKMGWPSDEESQNNLYNSIHLAEIWWNNGTKKIWLIQGNKYIKLYEETVE